MTNIFLQMLGITYPLNKLHNDRVHGTFNMMMMLGGEGPVVRVMFDVGFCLGSHDQILYFGLFIKEMEQ